MSSGGLLSFHHAILEDIHDPSTSQLVLLARGLGLRKIVCTLMQIYDQPTNLVLLVNASSEEEAAIGEELCIMGCRRPGLRTVDYEMAKKDRQDLYKNGGLISVTSRILVVDMLQSDLPTELVTGLLVLHAEKVTALSLEAFIVRLYREKNNTGFLKAFSDQPEHITSGLSPLRSIMKELQLHSVLIYPRFHEAVKESLERRRADVIELYQPMTESMKEIHGALVQCMSTTMAELKRSNAMLDLDDLIVENAYFRSFDAIVRRQLDPVWHKVGPRTKQLVSDLATLRRLLTYLLNYDPLAFHAYLETIIASNAKSASGNPRQNQSPWLLTDAAHIIFQTAKKRCYVLRESPENVTSVLKDVIEISDDEDAWEALEEAEGIAYREPNTMVRRQSVAQTNLRPAWLPKNLEPVLEELPKWHLLAETLKEIEEEIMRQDSLSTTIRGNNVVLVMTSSTQTSSLLSEYSASIDPEAPSGQRGRRMLENKLKVFLHWKARLSAHSNEGLSRSSSVNQDPHGEEELDPALRKKDRDRAERGANRRRVRGGAPAIVSVPAQGRDSIPPLPREEESVLAAFIESPSITSGDAELALALSLEDSLPPDQEEFEPSYGLLVPAQTVVVRAYTDDGDDRLLAELRPRFIVMYEPNQDFVRRIEVYKALHPGLAVRVYFMVYQMSTEEHKYLASLRKEKDAFERLIKERGTMLLPIHESNRAASDVGEAIIKTISSRVAGGRIELSAEQPRVIVDMREFRSTLPSLLHASKMCIVPATLTIGDYILTPDICVERKSIPDLMSSFNNGRLYTQCELMSVHYKQPILLIEFEEQKSFSLEAGGQIVQDVKSYAKPKYPQRKTSGDKGAQEFPQAPSIQQKLVLLTLAFPRVRILWSSSPYATADIFKDLKANAHEPDYATAVAVGADSDPAAGQGVHRLAEELLNTLPGITAKNSGYVMGRVRSVRELCELSLEQVQDILGNEPGKACWEFLHWGEALIKSSAR